LTVRNRRAQRADLAHDELAARRRHLARMRSRTRHPDRLPKRDARAARHAPRGDELVLRDVHVRLYGGQLLQGRARVAEHRLDVVGDGVVAVASELPLALAERGLDARLADARGLRAIDAVRAALAAVPRIDEAAGADAAHAAVGAVGVGVAAAG